MSRYDDIINLPRPISKRHKPMSMVNRAAQFSSFAALTGYEAVIQETGRLTEEYQELDDYEKYRISDMINYLMEETLTPFEITCFMQDDRKEGGSYVTFKTTLKKVIPEEGIIVIEDGRRIGIENIRDIRIL